MAVSGYITHHNEVGGGWVGVGYPRSANSWVRYIVKSCRGEAEVPVHFMKDENDYYIKRHWMQRYPYYNNMSRGFILLLRNYKEVIVRHNKQDKTDDPDFLFYQSLVRMPDEQSNPAVSYIHPIFLYDNWSGGPKHIVYYEDLMEKPHEIIEELGEVMNFETKEFLENYDYHKNHSIQAYDKEEGSWTKGGEIKDAYKDDLTDEQRKAWDAHLRENFPYLFAAFLKRYADE